MVVSGNDEIDDHVYDDTLYNRLYNENVLERAEILYNLSITQKLSAKPVSSDEIELILIFRLNKLISLHCNLFQLIFVLFVFILII